MSWEKIVAVLMAVVCVAAGCGSDDGGGSGDGGASGPLVLTGAQLADVVPPADAVAEVMGAEKVEVVSGSILMMLINPGDEDDEIPPGTEVEAHDYWSLDSGSRTIGEGPVDFTAVAVLLVAEAPDVVPLFDQITRAEPEYTRWVPVTVRGAAAAEQAVAIPYEGEPDDEPAFEAILARRDKLIVMVSVSGSDTDTLAATATALVELVFERAGEVSDDGGVSVGGGGTGDPLADSLAEQVIDNGDLFGLNDDQADCFATQLISQTSEERLGALGLTIDNIPSIYQVDWTDEEIDLLANSLDTCVGGDPDTVKAILVGPIGRHRPDFADCYAAELSAASGEDFYLDLFRARFKPPPAEAEEAIGDDEDPLLALLSAAAEVCQPNQPTPLPPLAEAD